jgi:hypothetical protein
MAMARLDPLSCHAAVLSAVLAAAVLPPATAGEFSASLRSHGLARQTAATGPLAHAHALYGGIAADQPSEGAAQLQMQGSTQWAGLQWHADVLAQAQRPEGGPGHTQAAVLEAYAAGQAVAWQWTAGRKVVGWDVGYGFRPNDLVQQEQRRTLVSQPLQGRPVLMAEQFGAESAWSLVAVNPTTGRDATGPGEGALAARWYQRLGSADAYAFARWGRRTQGSVGAAWSWVASDALELHASLRHLARFDTWQDASASAGALANASPWRALTAGAAQQLLLGGTWTNAEQVSVLLEAWHDGTAPSRGQWKRWANRNAALQHLGAVGAPAVAVASNLAWQTQAFSASPSLHRQNLFARLAWTTGPWESALDLLYHPADGGRLITASLAWKGDRLRLEGGLRTSAGPGTAVVRQLPVQQQAYVQAVWVLN